MTTYGHERDPLLLQRLAAGVGAVFLLVGVAGFIPGVTTDVGDLEFAGHESGAMLLGVFQVSVLHNLIHVGLGVAGLAMAWRADVARLYLIGGGAAYLLVFLWGLLVADHDEANLIPLNQADDVLHVVLGLGMLLLGLLVGRTVSARDR